MVPAGTHEAVAWLAREIAERYPRFRLIRRERSPLMRVLYVLALMPLYNRGFLREMATTIGYRVYMPGPLLADPVAGTAVLRHERVHLEQFRRHPVWFPVSYLLVAPALVTMRARWELEAYVETMRVELERTGSVSDGTLEWIAGQFTGPAYLFMDVRRRHVRRKLADARARLVADRG